MKKFVAVFRLGVGVCIISSILVQLIVLKESAIHYFSYFTILSNLLSGLVFLFSNFIPEKLKIFLRGFVILCMTLTSLGFIFLLGGKNDALLPWISILFHYVFPLVVFLDWVWVKGEKITMKHILFWILFLVIYLFYALILGLVMQWYPYDFLDVKSVGLNGVLTYIGILLIASVIVSWTLSLCSGKLYAFLKKMH